MTAISFPRSSGSPSGATARAFPRIRLPDPVGIVAFLGYLSLGAYLTLVLHAYFGDAYSRVANAYYVLFSRDPHLAAVGFVWMPLPSLVEMALLPFKGLLPALVDQGLAAVVMSATFMALAVTTMNGTLADWGLRRPARLALVAAFALQPMIVYFGANGASEAPTIFFMLLACRHLARYARTSSTRDLVFIGLALAGGYLTRYEAAAAAIGVAGLIMLLALRRVPGSMRTRLVHGAAEIAVATVPFVLVFVGWALASWILVGSPFTQLGQAAAGREAVTYSRSDEMARWAALGVNEVGWPLGPSITVAVIRLLVLSIAAPIGALGALWLVAARRDWRPLAVAAVFGPMLAFMVLLYLVHQVNPWLRYFITVIPAGILLLGCLLAPREGRQPSRSQVQRRGTLPGLALVRALAARERAPFVAAIVLVGAFVSIPVSGFGMLNPTVAREESLDITPLLGPAAFAADRPGNQLHTFATEQAVATYVDALGLTSGKVLIDVTDGFAILTWSRYPQQFVITPDRDFLRGMADPETFGIDYLLAGNDAVSGSYPSTHGFSEVVHVFPGLGGSPTWTLYRLVR